MTSNRGVIAGAAFAGVVLYAVTLYWASRLGWWLSGL